MITGSICCLYRNSGAIAVQAPQVVIAGERTPMVRKGVLETAQKVLLVAMVFIVLIIGYLSWQALRPQDDTTAWGLPSPVPTATLGPTSEPSPKVGIVAGHYGFDSGAICPDGLQEVEITFAIAEKVVALLRRKGYQVELLGEFDEAILGYQADAFVSLHADSCDIAGASGFKVARVTHSAVPEEEDHLVECLWDEYEKWTGLARHEDSITSDMRQYHAFRKIDPETPGAIIEMGFMLDDRNILLYEQQKVARGIASGVICFLEDSSSE
jgi:N-acetylmuramoyl-L-alanine amidase